MSVFSMLYDLVDQRFPLVFLTLTAIGAVGLARGRGGNKPNWGAHLKRLKHTSAVAVAIFIVSMVKIAIEADMRLDVLLRVRLVELLLPGLGILASLTYFFGFFGILFVAQMEGDDLQTVDAPAVKTTGTEPEVIVIGAGVVGAATALSFAKQGRRVVLFERDLSEPDRIVGELLQPGGIRALERLGIVDCAKENIDSIYVRGYMILEPETAPGVSRFVRCLYPDADPHTTLEYFGMVDNNSAATKRVKDEPRGRSFHHGRFVQALRQKCLEHENIQVIEGTVVGLIEENNCVVGIEYKRTKAGETISTDIFTQYAPLTMIADGIGSGFRKQMSDSQSIVTSSWVGVIVNHPAGEPPLPHPTFGHVVMAKPAPILIYQISSTETRVLVNILGKLPSAASGELQRFLLEKSAPQLPEIFKPGFIRAVEEGNLKSMPAKFHSAMPPKKRGALLIGDALNMRNPLTGGGMTVGLRDAESIGRLLSSLPDLGDHKAINTKYNLFLTRRKSYASTVNVLADALHAVFSVPGADPTREDMRTACFDYLSLGGPYLAGPVGLLSGLTPKTEVLATHFFMVALFGMKQIFLTQPSLANLMRVHRLLTVACSIIMPLLTMERTTIFSLWPVRKFINLVFPWEGKQ